MILHPVANTNYVCRVVFHEKFPLPKSVRESQPAMTAMFGLNGEKLNLLKILPLSNSTQLVVSQTLYMQNVCTSIELQTTTEL